MKNFRMNIALVAIALSSSQAFAAADLAKVNGAAITDKDLRNALSGLNEGQRETVLRDMNSRRQVLNSLIDQEVLVGEAAKQKLDQDAEYKEALSQFRKQYLASRVLQKNLGTKMTEGAAKQYYETNKRYYSTDQVHAMHILVSDEGKAREVMEMAKAPKADFQALAEKYSKDPSAKNNRGDLGFFGRDRMVDEFTEAAFAGKDGEIVGPVKTAYGYHIIKVIEKKLGKPMEYSEVELKVKNDLRQKLTENYISKLREQSKITVDEKALNKI